jgi:hypothetical protein
MIWNLVRSVMTQGGLVDALRDRINRFPQNVKNHQTNYKHQLPERTKCLSTQGIQIPYI